MALTRKKYVLDKKFQLGLSARAIILPLLTTLAICGILLYFAGDTTSLTKENSKNMTAIIDTQDSMLDMFMGIPSLQDSANPIVKKCDSAFKENLKITNRINDNHERIRRNSRIVLGILIVMTIVQTAIIFFQFIFFSHKISGPLHVMTNYLREFRSGKCPEYRPLRKNDELREFYDEFWETMKCLKKE
jgi:nitrogen fixation/metabolism regulation signal transduction histidine kinase